MQRGRRRRGKSGGPPRPREQIRPLQRPVSAGKFASSRVEPFSFLPDKILPGTLRHSGNRPAPPSDHTPLARRSAFQHGRKRGWRGNSDAPAGLKYFQREDFCRACARRRCLSAWNHGTLRFHSRYCRGKREIPMNHQGVEYTLTRSGNPGVLAAAISDRRPGQVGKDRGTACPVGHAPRRVENRSRAEARSAPTDVLIGVRLIGVRAGTPGLSAPSQVFNRR